MLLSHKRNSPHVGLASAGWCGRGWLKRGMTALVVIAYLPLVGNCRCRDELSLSTGTPSEMDQALLPVFNLQLHCLQIKAVRPRESTLIVSRVEENRTGQKLIVMSKAFITDQHTRHKPSLTQVCSFDMHPARGHLSRPLPYICSSLVALLS